MSEASLTSPSGSSLIDRHLVAAAVAAAGGGSLTVNPGHQGDNTTTTAAFAPVEQSASSPATTPAAPDADLCPKPVVHSAQALVTHLHHRHPTATASSAGPATTTPTTTTSPISTPTTTFSPSFSSLLLLEPTLPDPFPLPSAASPRESLPTPIYEDSRGLDLSLGFAAAAVLPSTDVTLPTPPVLRSAHNLRLPSFDVLGIAAPHPDRIPLNRSSHSFASLGTGPLSNPEDPLHALSPPLDHLSQTAEPEPVADNSCASPKAAKAQGDRIVPIVTPPSEPGTFHWGSFVNLVVRPEGLGSPPNSDPSHSPSLNTTTTTPSSLDPVSTARGPEITGIDNAVGTVSMDTWVPEVKDTIITQSGCLDLDTVRVLSHALPCPSLTGHLFGQLIAAIHDRTTTHTAWINVFHAVPGRFTLSDLPKSPPSTPGPAVGGDEYFTSKIFDSAVAIPDYQLDSKLLPPSPRPVVPPGSVNISIVERYIPPTNTNEFSEMFQFKGRSLLFDRLVELSSDNGILLFVYPTKTGGQTFMHHYLGPILDPLLRTVTVVHDLTSDLGKNLGQMRSVAHLDEYNTLKAKVVTFCDTLSTGQANPTSSKATYQVIRASREEVMLERSSWANDWWIKQEKPRVRESVTKYFRKAKKLPVNTEMTGAHLIQEVLDGVAKREYEGFEPTKGVEVGVFIIKKSK